MYFDIPLRSKLDGTLFNFTEASELTAQVEADYFVEFCEFELVSIEKHNPA